MNAREVTKRKDACLNAESSITGSQNPWRIPTNRRCDVGYFSSRSISTVWGGTQPRCGKSSTNSTETERRQTHLRREMIDQVPPITGLDMVRTASLVLLFGSLNLMTQTSTEILDRALLRQTVCGPIGVQARMIDTSQDRPAEPHQTVGITLNNLKSTPIVLERYTLHFNAETSTSGAPFEAEIKVPVNAGQEAFLLHQRQFQTLSAMLRLT
jgi:hypothetical protein